MLEFGVSGKLINNALVMYDRETRSLWSQFLSFSVQGEFEGTPLEPVPLVLTTWDEWSEQYPDTMALRKPSSSSRDTYAGYYQNSDAGVIGEANRDDRLNRKELVLGAGFDEGAVAFPHSQLRDDPVVNDEVAGAPALIYYQERSATALAYSRRVDGQELTFRIDDSGGSGQEILIDDETGSRWLPFTGQAIDGPLAGKSLERLHAVNVFWFAWTDFYPDTEVFGL